MSLTSIHDRRPYKLDQLATELSAYPVGSFDLHGDGRLRITYTVEWMPDADLVAVGEIVAAHVPDENKQLEQLVEKARAVWNGTDTFTQAQAQKILAGLVLLEARRR